MISSLLVLLAHGSKDKHWCDRFFYLLRDLQSEAGEDRVALAFMEFVSPTLLDTAVMAVACGVQQLKILPMFMASGAHMATDVPEQLIAVRQALPHLEIEVLPPIGEHPAVAQVIRWIALKAAGVQKLHLKEAGA